MMYEFHFSLKEDQKKHFQNKTRTTEEKPSVVIWYDSDAEHAGNSRAGDTRINHGDPQYTNTCQHSTPTHSPQQPTSKPRSWLTHRYKK